MVENDSFQLDNGAYMCKPCNLGMRPIHVASMHAAAETLEVFLQYGMLTFLSEFK